MRWGRVLAGGFLAELMVFAIVFPVLYIYLVIAWGQPQPFLYKIAHGMKISGGAAGGLVGSRRKAKKAA